MMNKDYEDVEIIKNNVQHIKYSILEAIGVYGLSKEKDIKEHCKSKKHYTDNSYNITILSFEDAGVISLFDTSSSDKLYKLTPQGIMLFEGIFQKKPVKVKIKRKMNENVKKVFEILDVEPYEEFKVQYNENDSYYIGEAVYYIDEKLIIYNRVSPSLYNPVPDNWLQRIIVGELQIVKLPRKTQNI